MITLLLEMGPSRWIPEVLQAAGVHGMLVFVWISGLMALLRLFAGTFVEKFSPTGILLGASVLTGTGLMLFAFIETGWLPFMLTATVFACGVAFYFPTMAGLMSERFPKAGSLGIVLLIGFGFFAAGGANAIMGSIADQYLPDALDELKIVTLLKQVEERFLDYVKQAEAASGSTERLAELGYRAADVRNVLERSEAAMEYYLQNNDLDGVLTGNALRAIVDVNLDQEQELIDEAFQILRPADNYSSRMSFFWVGPVAFLVALVFLVLYIRDKKQGGYKAVDLVSDES